MDIFDFIAHDGFKKQLEADYEELKRCDENGCHKSVVVLAGSIFEALLCDYLISEFEMLPNDVYKKSFALLIDEAFPEPSSEPELICMAVKNWRNLIHPGRSERVRETVDHHTCKLVIDLLEWFVKFLKSNQREKYEISAENFFNRLLEDESAIKQSDYFIKKISPSDRRKLVLQMIPEKLFAILKSDISLSNQNSRKIDNLIQWYDKLYNFSDPDTRLQAIQYYLDLINCKGGEYMQLEYFEKSLFRSKRLHELEIPIRNQIIDRLLVKIEEYLETKYFCNLYFSVISSVTSKVQMKRYVTFLFNSAYTHENPLVREKVRDHIKLEFDLEPNIIKLRTNQLRYLNKLVADLENQLIDPEKYEIDIEEQLNPARSEDIDLFTDIQYAISEALDYQGNLGSEEDDPINQAFSSEDFGIPYLQ